jgi:hypothetical protein
MSNIKIFENKKVRSQYDADKEMWYFSIVDIVGILTEQPTVDRARSRGRIVREHKNDRAPSNPVLADVSSVSIRTIEPVLADVSSVSIRTIEPKATLILKNTPNGRLLI